MDQSLWSDPLVIEASRKFVCARLATYEDAGEGQLLEGIYRGRSGQLENTVFVMLASDGKTKLSRSGRSPTMVFGGSVGWEGTVLALEMENIAEAHPPPKDHKTTASPALPIAKNVRLAVNIAACDRLPLVISGGLDAVQLQSLATVGWKEPYVGRFGWAATQEPAQLKAVGIEKPSAGIWVVQPGNFGLTVEVIAKLAADADQETIAKALDRALETSRPSQKRTRLHTQQGQRLGKKWETEIPVTDPGIPPKSDRRRGGRN
ncbi:MAG: thioredoxin family protein [Planctomycetota bacterium]|nr:thioredoxin family protein [Planctomycetota bacterium]